MDSYIKQLNFDEFSALPTKEELLKKCDALGIKALPMSNYNGDVILQADEVSIDDFLTLVHSNSATLFYYIAPYSSDACLITSTDLDDEDTVGKIINTLSLDTIEELGFAVDEANEQLIPQNEEEDTIKFSIWSFLGEDEEDNDEETNWFDEIKGKGKQLFQDIKNYNNDVPKDCSIYTKSITLCTIVNSKAILLRVENKYMVDTSIVLAEIVAPYKVEYEEYKEQQLKKQLQKQQEETQKRTELKSALIRLLKADATFIKCTNQTFRKQFARDMGDNPDYSDILEELTDLGVISGMGDLYALLDQIYREIK